MNQDMSLLGRIVRVHVLNATPGAASRPRWGIIILALLCLMAAGLLLSGLSGD